MSSNFCNPVNFEDFYTELPVETREPQAAPPGPDPTPPGPLFDDKAPGGQTFGLVYKNMPKHTLVYNQLPEQQRVEVAAAASTTRARQDVDTADQVLEGIARKVDALRAFGNNLDQIDNFFQDTGRLRALLGNVRELLSGTVIHDAEALKAFDTFVSSNITPLLGWAQRVNSLTSVNLDPRSGSMGVALGVITDVLNVAAPWSSAGQSVDTWGKAATASLKNVMNAADDAARTVAAASALLAAAEKTLLAACHALPALDLQLKGIADRLSAIFNPNLDFFGQFFKLPLLNGISLSLPKFPIFSELSKFAGVATKLFSTDTLKQCIGPWQAMRPDSPWPYIQPNPNAVRDGIAGIKAGIGAADSLGRGVGKVQTGFSTSLDPLRAAYEGVPSMSGLAPNPAHMLPENAADMAARAGGTVPSPTKPDDVKPGRSHLVYNDLVDVCTDPETGEDSPVPAVPGPAKAVAARTAVVKDLAGTVRAASTFAEAMNRAGQAMLRLGPGATSADARKALKEILGASMVTTLLQNMALDPGLDAKSLSRAARDYYLCLNERGTAGQLPPVTDPEVARTRLDEAVDAIAGLPNSPVTIAAVHRPGLADPEAATARLPISALPEGFYDTTQQLRFDAARDPANTSIDLEDLPFLLISQTASQWDTYMRFKGLLGLIREIQANAPLKAAHLSMRQKAISQGYGASSPYIQLAEGVILLGATDPTELIIDFLRHGDADIRPLASWLAGMAAVDFEVPLPIGLNSAENQAAEASYDYVNVERLDFRPTLMAWRLLADEAGLALGYEYFAALGAAAMMVRLSGAIEADMPDAVITEVATQARRMAGYLTHGQRLVAVLDAIAKE